MKLNEITQIEKEVAVLKADLAKKKSPGKPKLEVTGVIKAFKALNGGLSYEEVVEKFGKADAMKAKEMKDNIKSVNDISQNPLDQKTQTQQWKKRENFVQNNSDLVLSRELASRSERFNTYNAIISDSTLEVVDQHQLIDLVLGRPSPFGGSVKVGKREDGKVLIRVIVFND